MGDLIKTIQLEEFKKKLDSEKYILIDVRTEEEHDNQKIAESEVFDISSPDFLEELKGLDKEQKYLIYCASGTRSNYALNIMRQMGFREVYDLAGGIFSWVF